MIFNSTKIGEKENIAPKVIFEDAVKQNFYEKEQIEKEIKVS